MNKQEFQTSKKASWRNHLVHQLKPRIWKEMFAENPLRSDLHDLGDRRTYAVA